MLRRICKFEPLFWKRTTTFWPHNSVERNKNKLHWLSKNSGKKFLWICEMTILTFSFLGCEVHFTLTCSPNEGRSLSSLHAHCNSLHSHFTLVSLSETLVHSSHTLFHANCLELFAIVSRSIIPQFFQGHFRHASRSFYVCFMFALHCFHFCFQRSKDLRSDFFRVEN